MLLIKHPHPNSRGCIPHSWHISHISLYQAILAIINLNQSDHFVFAFVVSIVVPQRSLNLTPPSPPSTSQHLPPRPRVKSLLQELCLSANLVNISILERGNVHLVARADTATVPPRRAHCAQLGDMPSGVAKARSINAPPACRAFTARQVHTVPGVVSVDTPPARA